MNNIISVKVSAFRNFKKYKFLSKLTPKDKEEIIDSLLNSLGENFTLIGKSDFEKADTNLKRLLSKCGNNVIVSKSNDVVVNLFTSEIVEIMSINSSLDEAYNAVSSVANALANKLELAFSDDYGYLQSDIKKVGSGYSFEANVNLIALQEMNKVNQLKQNLQKLGYNLNKTEYESIYSLSGGCNLGYSEKQTFEDFNKMLQKIDSLELESAKLLDLTKHDEIIDRTRRSVAILESAFILNQEELLQCLNNIRLGLDVGVCDMDYNLLQKLQNLITNSSEFNSSTEAKELAKQVNLIIKGE